MKWQDKVLRENEEECQQVNQALSGNSMVPYRSLRDRFIDDGRMEAFMSIPTPNDIDFSVFPELDFTKKARESLDRSNELVDAMNELMAQFGEEPISRLEDTLLEKNRLDEFLRNPLSD